VNNRPLTSPPQPDSKEAGGVQCMDLKRKRSRNQGGSDLSLVALRADAEVRKPIKDPYVIVGAGFTKRRFVVLHRLNRKPVARQRLDEIKVIAVAQATRQANLLHRTSFLPLMSGRVAPATEVPKERTVWNARHQLALKRENASLRADRATSRAQRRDGDYWPSTATLSRRDFLSYAAQTVFDF
jgi:hypothetical protein